MKKVSQIASGIYQAAKKAATGAWDWRDEWKKAMQEAAKSVFAKVKNAAMTLAMAYCGKGSDKQVAWAASIYKKDMQRAIDGYADAQRRVQEQTMPTLWTAMWDQVLSDSRVIEVVSRYASQSARDTIDYKGLRTARGSASVGMWIEKLATEEYNKAKAAGAEMVYA